MHRTYPFISPSDPVLLLSAGMTLWAHGMWMVRVGRGGSADGTCHSTRREASTFRGPGLVHGCRPTCNLYQLVMPVLNTWTDSFHVYVLVRRFPYLHSAFPFMCALQKYHMSTFHHISVVLGFFLVSRARNLLVPTVCAYASSPCTYRYLLAVTEHGICHVHRACMSACWRTFLHPNPPGCAGAPPAGCCVACSLHDPHLPSRKRQCPAGRGIWHAHGSVPVIGQRERWGGWRGERVRAAGQGHAHASG